MGLELTEEQLNSLASKIAERLIVKVAPAPKVVEPDTMTTADVAKYLECSISTVRRYIRNIEFPVARKIGGEFRFSRKEIEYWFNTKKKFEAERTFKGLRG